VGFQLRSPWPNPARGEVRLSLDLESPVDVDVRVHDVSGREVARPVAHEHLSGRIVRTWRPVDLPSGLYYVRARLGAREQVRRFVWLGTR
jgi:Secretion system C-terminal sorting domain